MNDIEARVIILPYKKIILGTCAFVLVVSFLLSFPYLNNVYIPALVSYFLAFLLSPTVDYAEKRGFGRVGPIAVLLLFFFFALVFMIILIVPRLTIQLKDLFHEVPSLVDSLTFWFVPYSIEYLGYDIFSDWKKFIGDILPQISTLPANAIVSNLFNSTIHALGTLVSVLLVPVLTFYMLKDYHLINASILKLMPRRHVPAVQEVSRRLALVLGGLIRGQFLVCAILATFYMIALTAVGMDLSLIIGILAGILNIIPFVGPLIALVFSILISVLGGKGLSLCAGIVGVFLVANLLDNTVLTPKIVGKKMGVSSLTVILVLIAGGELLGFLGMLLALPVTAMVKVLSGYMIEQYFSTPYYKSSE